MKLFKKPISKIKQSMPEYFYDAHKYSRKHRKALEKDKLCGCFYCLQIYNPSEIQNWLNEGDGTAICPYCDIDSVIGENSGYEITKKFLKEMNRYWFKEK